MALSPQGIVSFPSLDSPSDMSKKYEVTLVFTPDCDQSLLKAMKEDYLNKLQEKFPKLKKEEFIHPFKKTSEGNPKFYGEFPEGSIYISFKSSRQVPIVDFNKETIPAVDVIYGDIAHVSYAVYAYDQGRNKGVAFGLQALQKIKDGGNSTGGLSEFDVFEGGSNTPNLGLEDDEEVGGYAPASELDSENSDIPF